MSIKERGEADIFRGVTIYDLSFNDTWYLLYYTNSYLVNLLGETISLLLLVVLQTVIK